ncbi:hypothetical protein KIN20_033414 [Parelaphostrongylus tenuis]|uniref:Uncharacterized protein n=1 Tax=Parelaphostrongylus tenuis TaxID=148309 RepID=A0AAD5R806_PARTN|nr:hypothetical protein KIN20_033414 [Parelaphostrongylus tenuis]
MVFLIFLALPGKIHGYNIEQDHNPNIVFFAVNTEIERDDMPVPVSTSSSVRNKQCSCVNDSMARRHNVDRSFIINSDDRVYMKVRPLSAQPLGVLRHFDDSIDGLLVMLEWRLAELVNGDVVVFRKSLQEVVCCARKNVQ